MNLTLLFIWLGVAILFVILEAATPQLVAIWFAGGAVAAVIAWLLNAPPWLQIIVFIVVSFLLLLATRPFVKKVLKTKHERTNADRLPGQTAIVLEPIDNDAGKGQIKVSGQVWTARSVDDTLIEVGEKVVIQRIDGVKLIVK